SMVLRSCGVRLCVQPACLQQTRTSRAACSTFSHTNPDGQSALVMQRTRAFGMLGLSVQAASASARPRPRPRAPRLEPQPDDATDSSRRDDWTNRDRVAAAAATVTGSGREHAREREGGHRPGQRRDADAVADELPGLEAGAVLEPAIERAGIG